MRIGGTYVGLGIGDSNDEIRRLKAHLRKKFSYAKDLPDTPDYDQQMADVVLRMQAAYNAQGKLHSPTGIVDYATKLACGFIVRPQPADTRPVLFTVCGTGVPWWVGPDADTARAVEGRYRWQPIGYPAQPFPMAPSIAAGRAELIHQIGNHRERIKKYGMALMGYSQGAIVVSQCWQEDIRPDGGRLHWAAKHLSKAVTFGNPMREQGHVWSDPGGAPALMTSHGIADELLTDTPPWWRDYAHAGDLYTDCQGQSAENKTAIYKVVMGTRIMQGPDSLIAQVLELTQSPATEAIAMLKAILDAGLFFGRQTGPHINYSPSAAIDYLRA